MLVVLYALFVLAASCFLLYVISEHLEESGVALGHALRVPDDVIAATFQALATSGPEIVMAAQAVCYTQDAKACSGLLNMSFSAMDNLVGIGCLGMLYMVSKGTVNKDEVVVLSFGAMKGLRFYILASALLAIFISFDMKIDVLESWVLMVVGVVYILSQFSGSVKREVPSSKGFACLCLNLFIYCACVFGLWVVIRECLQATFLMASVGFVSIAGVLVMFTSYVSSFPEFILTYRYVSQGKKDNVLGMLFGSNVLNLAFSGFRCIWTGQAMQIVATNYLPIYIVLLPVVALFIYVMVVSKRLKYVHAYPLLAGYVVYITSGFFLL